MKITKLEIEDFGKFHQYQLELSQGFTMIYGANEDGKSTLMAFIRLMFYSNQKSVRDLSNLRKKYLPWGKDTMSGAIELMTDKKLYRIQKSFGATAARDEIDIYCITTGEKLLLPKETEAGEWFFHLDQDAFERSLFIGQPGPVLTYDGKKKDDIAENLKNIETTGDESISAEDVLRRIQEAKEGMVSKRQSSGVLVQSKAREAELFQKIAKMKQTEDDLRLRHEEARDLNRSRDDIKRKKDDLEKQLEKEQEAVEQVLEAKNTLEECRRRSDLQKIQVENEKNILHTKLSMEEEKLTLLKKSEPTAVDKKSVRNYILAGILAAVCGVMGAVMIHKAFLVLLLFSVLSGVLAIGRLRAIERHAKSLHEWQMNISTCSKKILEYREAEEAGKKQELLLKSFEEIQREAEEDLIKKQKIYQFYTEIREDYKSCLRELDVVKQQIFVLLSSFKQPEEGLEELMGEQRVIHERIMEQQEYYDALVLCHEIMQEAADEIRHTYAPKLGQVSGNIFAGLTKQKYQHLLVSKTYDISVLPEGAQYRDGAYFSGGTTDQMYFALRMGILQLLEEKEHKNYFLLLDDSFTAYDESRLELALQYIDLYCKGEEKQVIMFTCHRYLIDLAVEAGILFESKNLRC